VVLGLLHLRSYQRNECSSDARPIFRNADSYSPFPSCADAVCSSESFTHFILESGVEFHETAIYTNIHNLILVYSQACCIGEFVRCSGRGLSEVESFDIFDDS